MEKNRYHFERLTPIDSMDLSVYEDAINYVFSNQDIRNVAISGAYSAGKSSVLASYKKKHKDLYFLHISLAHFKSPHQEETDVKESVLEGKILNQLLHQIPAEKIPQTNFRVKKKIAAGGILKRTVEASVVLLAVIYFLCFDMWKDYVLALPDSWLKAVLSFSAHSYALMADGILLFGLSFFFLYSLINIQRNKLLFRRLNLQGNEIEIFEESDDSYFDKYLNEVLYLFANANADAIVFEDMDRFSTNRIFERLREINMLVNFQLQKEKKQVLRFFYLLRDDVFASKDRIKFFDYILPVVPVVDGSNSYNQIISLFQNGGLLEKFDEDFLQGLSLYIDDMRLLKNIYNEFVVYYNRLNITELDGNKMLAMITYKNLFPRDFAELQLNQGFVYTLFSKKGVFIAGEIEKLHERISEISKEIDYVKKEHLTSVKELDILYSEKRGWNGKIRDEDKECYEKRKQAIEYKENDRIFELRNEKAALEKEIILMKNRKLQEIITRENINSIFSTTSTNEIGQEEFFYETKGSEYFDLLKYLIRNGYINETYVDYMTYFYENSLSRTDKMFLRSVADRRAKEYTYELKNPSLIVSKLKLVDFGQEETLNFDLLTYLLHTPFYEKYLYKLMDQLKETENFQFVGAYFDAAEEPSVYVKYLNLRWPELFGTALYEHALTEEQLRRYSLCSLYYSDDKTIKAVNQKNSLCDYISHATDYLAMKHPDIDKLIHAFELLKVRFVGFEGNRLHKELFRAVYEKSLYEINEGNLLLMQREVFGIKDEEELFHRNYTLLLRHPDSALFQYMNFDITQYMNAILGMSDGTILDEEVAAIAILNHPDIVMAHKEAYICGLKTIITEIKKVSDISLWPLLVECDTILCSEDNVMEYFNAVKSFDDKIVSFINRSSIFLDFSKTEYNDQMKWEFLEGVSACRNMENSKYMQIVQTLGICYTIFHVFDIAEDKLAILIDMGSISMNAENLVFIRKYYPNAIIHFIQKNIDAYVEIMQSQLLVQEELLEILTWVQVSDERKIALLKFTNVKISILDEKQYYELRYSSAVCVYILSHNLMKSDLEKLFLFFERYDASVQEAIFGLAVKNITKITSNPKIASGRLRNMLLQSEQLDEDIKDRLSAEEF